MAYNVFTRTWWKKNREWPQGRKPHAGRKSYLRRGIATEAEARALCQEWNRNHDPGPLSRKAEYERA